MSAREYAAMFMKMNNLFHEGGYVHERKWGWTKSPVENRDGGDARSTALLLSPRRVGCHGLNFDQALDFLPAHFLNHWYSR
jgi:hypothetical protein